MMKKPHWSYTMIITFCVLAGLSISYQDKIAELSSFYGINDISQSLKGQSIGVPKESSVEKENTEESTHKKPKSEKTQTEEKQTKEAKNAEKNLEEERNKIEEETDAIISPPPPRDDEDYKKELERELEEKEKEESKTTTDIKPLICDDSLYIQQTRDNITNVSTIFIKGDEIGFKDIASKLPFDMNSIAYDPIENYIYGIKKDDEAIVRIGQDGKYEIIGTVGLKSHPYSGTFLADGTYVVNNKSTLWHISIEDKKIIKTVDMKGQFADIARNPIDGFFYGFDDKALMLAKVNPHTGDVEYIGKKSEEIAQIGSAMFDSKGNLYLYGRKAGGKEQDSLFITNVKNAEFKFVGKGKAVTGSDGASCVKGKDVPDDEDPEPTDITEVLGNSVPSTVTVSTCQDNVKGNPDLGQSCVQMFPTEDPFDKEKQAAYEKFKSCTKEQKSQIECVNQWAKDLKLKTCNSDSECKEGGTTTIIAPAEIKHEEGCFEFNENVYCPHAYEGECINIIDFDGKEAVYCQPANQENVVVKTCIDQFYPAIADYYQSRNDVSCSLQKYGKYMKPSEGVFTVPTRDPVLTTELRFAQGVCETNINPTFGPFIVKDEFPCKPTFPDKYNSQNYDKYGECVLEGGRKDECTIKWLSKEQFCTQASDCK